MEKRKKIIVFLIILVIIFSSVFSLLLNHVKAVTQTISEDINGIDDVAYPGIKPKIQELKKAHPNWNFKIMYTDLDWNSVIAGEYVGHGSSPSNLVYQSTNYQGDWICPICGNKAYDNGNWKCASEVAIKYMMDPRNSLNETDIFQFEQLTYNGHDNTIIDNMTKGTFLQGHTAGIVNVAQTQQINPYYIVARLIQEQGTSGTALTNGQGYNGQYIGYYNPFNIGASGTGNAEIMLNGLSYAKTQEWTSFDKAISEGINFLSKEYIKKGQDTLYLQKFDVENNHEGLYWHQYMQNILAAQTEGTSLRKTYEKMNSVNSTHTFIIPVYKNMPTTASARPNGYGNASVNSDLVKVNANPSLYLRDSPNGNIDKNKYVSKDEIVTRIEKATTKVGGTYWDKIQKSDGTTGYAARETYENEANYKLYLVPITSEGGDSGNTPSNITKGDINKDGKIDAMDMYLMIQHILENSKLSGDTFKSADINDDNKIDAMDMYLIIQKIINS